MSKWFGNTLIVVALMGLATTVNAQPNEGWIIDIENDTLGPAGSGLPQSTKVTVSATFGANAFAFAAGQFDLTITGDTADEWSGNRLMPPVNVDPVPVGERGPNGFRGVRAGQIHFPAIPITADSTNPIGVWEATFTAADFSEPRTIEILTNTNRFAVYLASDSATSEPRTDITEAFASFQVIPEPACGLVLGLGGVVTLLGRRRA